jgi:hypothetical protein
MIWYFVVSIKVFLCDFMRIKSLYGIFYFKTIVIVLEKQILRNIIMHDIMISLVPFFLYLYQILSK